MSRNTLGALYRSVAAAAALGSAWAMSAPEALAVPSFARQTGMACEACHTVFPELTHFGRVFKANGYRLTNLKQVRDVSGKKEELLELSQMPPLSIMAQISYTEMKTACPESLGRRSSRCRPERHCRLSAAVQLFLRGQDRAELRRHVPGHL